MSFDKDIYQPIRESFNQLAQNVRAGVTDINAAQKYLVQQIVSAPTKALQDLYREGYKTVFPDAKL